MYEFECLTIENNESVTMENCSPFFGECYPVASKDSCSPFYGACYPDT